MVKKKNKSEEKWIVLIEPRTEAFKISQSQRDKERARDNYAQDPHFIEQPDNFSESGKTRVYTQQ